MRPDDDAWLDVVDRFQAAPLTPGGWYEALAALAAVTGSRSGQLVGMGAPRAVPFNWVTGVSAEWGEEFVASGGGDPLRNPLVRAAGATGVLNVLATDEIIAPRDRKRNEFLQWHERRHDFAHICLTPLVKEPDIHVGLAVMRSGSQGEIDPHQRTMFASLSTHARAAVRTQIALENQGALLIAGAMEALSLPVFVCDRSGVVRSLTPQAETFVRAGGALRLRNGRLSTADSLSTKALSEAIRAAANGYNRPGAPVARAVLVADEPGKPLIAEVSPLPPRDYSFGFEPRALVILRGLQPDPDRIRTLLQSMYRLTAAESDVALRLAEGEAPEAIAAARGVSLGTIRVQIRALFSKLGVRRIHELTARLNLLR